MSKILPITYPSITSYPGRANVYAISENNSSIRPWLMENYIQTESLYMKERMECDIDFFIEPTIIYRNNTALEAQYVFNPYLKIMTMDTLEIETKDIISFIVSHIDKGYYISIGINTGYIKAYDHGRLHPIFIYGYNEKKEELFIADFFKNGKYNFEKCSYFEMKEAIEHYDSKMITWGGHPHEKSRISLIKIDEHFRYAFHIQKFVDMLQEYLCKSSKLENIFRFSNGLYEETAFRKFGISHYDNMIEYMNQLIDEQEIIKNVRLFHVFYDHKVVLRQRIQYLIENKFCSDEYLDAYYDIEHKALVLRNLVLKERITGKNRNMRKIVNELRVLKEKEYQTIEKTVEMFG